MKYYLCLYVSKSRDPFLIYFPLAFAAERVGKNREESLCRARLEEANACRRRCWTFRIILRGKAKDE
jgi:hypothetical protein